jgi:hypothetical protein
MFNFAIASLLSLKRFAGEQAITDELRGLAPPAGIEPAPPLSSGALPSEVSVIYATGAASLFCALSTSPPCAFATFARKPTRFAEVQGRTSIARFFIWS